MKTVFVAILTFTINNLIGQVATIQDPDGWTNIRSDPDGKSEIILKIYESEVFWYDYEQTDSEQDWILVHIPKDRFCLGKSDASNITGFIHKSRLLPLEKLAKYSGNNFRFRYKLSDFDSTNRLVDKLDGKWVAAIDGRPVWGTDGNFPRVQVTGIEVNIDGQDLPVHQVFYSDIFECDNNFSVYKKEDTYFIHQWNSDGAGAYEIVWVLNKKGLKQRLVGAMI